MIAAASSAVGLAPSANAGHVSCGAVITASTTLHGNVGPCTSTAITVDADNVTLNLNGFRVFCTPNPGDGAGILVRQQQNVTVTNGTVTDCDAGVVIQNGSRNTVSRMTARDNIGQAPGSPTTGLGDGILIEGSSDNTIVGNLVDHNGPFSGIGLIEVPDSDHPFPAAPTTGNVIRNNVVTNSTPCRASGFCDNDGIRVEPQVGPGNVIDRNVVRNSGLDGISLFGFTTQNTVSNNHVEGNGFTGAVAGDGIRVFGFDNLIQRNTAIRNAAGGISVGRRPPSTAPFPATNPNGRNNRLLRNVARDNGILDLHDSNSPSCDNNTWSGNVGPNSAPACTLL
jgi:parallel beta-helix repeat protein